MRIAYGFKLQSQKNVIKLGNMIDDMWGIHLHIMLLARRYRRMFGKDVSAYKLKRHVTKLKKRTKPHWAALPSQVVQDVVLRYGKSQDAFFQNKKDRKAGKTNRKVGRPKIKSRHKYNSMTFTQAGYTLEENRIKINCIGTWFSFHKHRKIEGIIKTITIKRDRCGDYWIYFSCKKVDDSKLKSKTGKSAGFDYGNKTFLTSDAGDKIASPQFLKQSLKTLRTLNKALSRKVKGSGNWYRAARALARLHRKITRQREDWQWKLATELCTEFDVLCFETLNLDGMKRLWGRKVSDHAFYQFLQILEQKCAKHGKKLKKISQWTATTKPCSDCGYHNKELSLSDRQWTCPECDSHHDRDVNAAINIKRAGLAA
ncbi:MAG: RNA-guided endonuclease TnpB family protein [Candidatus Poribacteria bacterium]|nr:RNA-guided endonuclease TnpB family protein [Candidatus Poribacteria bacterium]MYK18134.1 transposase [Candidatus Poribacteria bacterium]